MMTLSWLEPLSVNPTFNFMGLAARFPAHNYRAVHCNTQACPQFSFTWASRLCRHWIIFTPPHQPKLVWTLIKFTWAPRKKKKTTPPLQLFAPNSHVELDLAAVDFALSFTKERAVESSIRPTQNGSFFHWPYCCLIVNILKNDSSQTFITSDNSWRKCAEKGRRLKRQTSVRMTQRQEFDSKYFITTKRLK